MSKKDIQKQLQFFAESDWNSQWMIYLDALERIAAERDRANRAEARIAYTLSVLRTGSIPLGLTEQGFKDSLIREACRALSSPGGTE